MTQAHIDEAFKIVDLLCDARDYLMHGGEMQEFTNKVNKAIAKADILKNITMEINNV